LNEPLLSGSLVFRTALVSVIIVVGALLLFNYEMRYEAASLGQAQATVVNTVMLVQAFYLLNCRSLNKSFFRVSLISNPMIWGGIVATAVAQAIFTYLPAFQRLFHTDSVPANVWLRVVVVGVAAFILIELVKYFEGRLPDGSQSVRPPKSLALRSD
jgi:magnesium-transporting ATPase (P-type)